jgi:hypothetical protein
MEIIRVIVLSVNHAILLSFELFDGAHFSQDKLKLLDVVCKAQHDLALDCFFHLILLCSPFLLNSFVPLTFQLLSSVLPMPVSLYTPKG